MGLSVIGIDLNPAAVILSRFYTLCGMDTTVRNDLLDSCDAVVNRIKTISQLSKQSNDPFGFLLDVLLLRLGSKGIESLSTEWTKLKRLASEVSSLKVSHTLRYHSLPRPSRSVWPIVVTVVKNLQVLI
jgi:hypothetical protein